MMSKHFVSKFLYCHVGNRAKSFFGAFCLTLDLCHVQDSKVSKISLKGNRKVLEENELILLA